jgi:hypothetical protein
VVWQGRAVIRSPYADSELCPLQIQPEKQETAWPILPSFEQEAGKSPVPDQ